MDFDFSGFQTVHLDKTNGSILREKRVVLGLTQKQVAERAKITLRQYQKFESGERNIMTCSFQMACRIIEALGMNISDFYHNEYIFGEEVYMDSEGALFPPSATGFCDVLVAGGNFTEPLRLDSLNAQASALKTVACFLDSEDDYAPLIDQIFIERDGDIMMVPKVGDHLVELGKADDLDAKFYNLLTFYRKGMPRAGWNTYSKISLKFKGQVVCTKK